MVRTLHLICLAESRAQAEGRYEVGGEGELTALGRRQTDELARRLAARPPLAVWSSPAQPSLEMAQLLVQAVAAEPALPIVSDADLAEIDYGAWAGLTRMEVAARWPAAVASWEREPTSMSLPGGEAIEAARQRGLASLERIRHAHASGAIAILTQGVMQRLLLAHFLGLPLAALWTLETLPAALCTVEDHDNPVILAINDGGHLKTVRSRFDVQVHRDDRSR